MKIFNAHQRSFCIMLLIIGCMAFFTTGFHFTKNNTIILPNGEAFAEDVTCMRYHQNIYNSYIHTAHLNSAAPATEQTIKGSFKPGENRYNYNPYDIVMLEKRDSGFYQVWYTPFREVAAYRFDIVTGSGNKGQSYLYWKGNQLFQLPVS
ncbi:hypothetical protein [Hydrotalea sp.]|uniref:hypothetical protein n=1 Tax=Hydrotalea sp. TaxID=2881279 RepID=UPI0026067CF1|nr:hypothetical protein [Hydrotalea sp.]